MKIAISGGGRTGHLYTVLLKQVLDVEVLWHTRRAEAILANMPAAGIDLVSNDRVIATGRPDMVTDDIGTVVAEADMVIFTQTNDGLPATVAAAAPHFSKTRPTYVGAIPSLGSGFDWLVQREVAGNENVFIWGLRGVPATSPSIQTGESVVLGGHKDTLYLGFADGVPGVHRNAIENILARLFPQPTVILNHFLEMTLSPPSLHPAVLYGLMGPYSQWDGQPFKERPRWWTDLSELSAYFMQRCDDEMQSVIHALESRLGVNLSHAGTMQGKQIDQYKSLVGDPRTLMTAYRTNSAFQSYVPMDKQSSGGYLFKKSHPGVRADLFFSMALYLELGRRLDLVLPYLQEIYTWGVDFIGEESQFPMDYLPSDWPPKLNSASKTAPTRGRSQLNTTVA